MTYDDMMVILKIQEMTCEKFGDIAVKKNYLSRNQVDELLREQSDSYLHFGEALVKSGSISPETLREQLEEYHKSKKITS